MSRAISLERLPRWVNRMVGWLETRWLGRVMLRTARSSVRIELFDRSMAIAAQLFTSVFPILILLGSWFGGSVVADSATDSVPERTKELITDALGTSATKVSFGLIGALIVLASATSLSRALTRAFAAIWELPRPRSRLVFAWRWVAVVLSLALSLVVTRVLFDVADNLEPEPLWVGAVALAGSASVMVFVPWCLLEGVIPPRAQLPGALIYGLVVALTEPVTGVLLARSLASSAARYGAIGIAFTFIAFLYAAAFVMLTASLVGEAIATDRGWLGSRLMELRSAGAVPTADATPVAHAAADDGAAVAANENPSGENATDPPDPPGGVTERHTR